jgi:hypothetical protein
MKAGINLFTSITFIALVACTAQHDLKHDATDVNKTDQMSGQNPPMTIMKGEKKLNLVRIMDGGICKNEFQGVKGAFLLYADPNDIDRIKREKGAAIFSAFESKIQDLSADVLQEAIDKTNLSEDPFALGEDDAQQKLANQLTRNFRSAASIAVDRFKKETTLTIDVTAFSPSLIFYQKGCEATQDQTQEAASYGQLVSY